MICGQILKRETIELNDQPVSGMERKGRIGENSSDLRNWMHGAASLRWRDLRKDHLTKDQAF